MNNIGGQKLPKKLTKKQLEAKKKENEETQAFKDEYVAITEKHNLMFKSVLTLQDGGIMPFVRLVNKEEQEQDEKKDKVRAKAFVDDYKVLEEKADFRLTAILFHDDITGEVRPKMQIVKKAKKDGKEK
jgi:hypothetical protein